MEDLDVMYNVHDLLNEKQRTNKVLDWRDLGRRFGIKKDTLGDLSPAQNLVYPTEALIRRLGSWKPFLTMTDFVWALHSINRRDALNILGIYLPGKSLVSHGWQSEVEVLM